MTEPTEVSTYQDPPTRLWQIAQHAGPGLIVAGSIVGSGELIATTKTGAEAGFSLLWLILIGCVVKVFAQIEFGRYTLQSGQTTLAALDQVPGPRWGKRGNWLVWYWMLMWFASISQLGGIVGGVGQSLAISLPLTQQGRDYNEWSDAKVMQSLSKFQVIEEAAEETPSVAPELQPGKVAELELAYQTKYAKIVGEPSSVTRPVDTLMWAGLITLATSLMLVIGRYGLVQSLSTFLVASFTLLTIVNLGLVQSQPEFHISLAEFLYGLAGHLPEAKTPDAKPITTALATFGIIGVGAAELVAYPYWCLEKGYAKSAGPNDGSAAWVARAKGWMRVMQFDAWGSMFVYTFATIAFYLLGAAILHRLGLNPTENDMIRTLAVMYVPVFSDWASSVFLFGAFAVLYSTFFVANAGHARVFSDAMRVVGWIEHDQVTRERWIRFLSGFFPILCFCVFVIFPNPTKLVLFSGIMQGIMLPMLAGAALYLRYRHTLPELKPGLKWDTALWISGVAMLITGSWTVIKAFLIK